MSVISLRKADRDDKRELILDEASAQFNERGFHDVRLEDIAEALGATKASISYHFQSKRALLEAAYMRSCDTIDGLLAEIEGEGGGTARLAAWCGKIAHWQAGALTNNRAQLAFFNDLGALEEAARKRIGMRIATQLGSIEKFLHDGGAASVGRGTTLLFWSMPAWLGPWLSAIPSRRHARQIDLLAHLMLRGAASTSTLPAPGSLSIPVGGADLLFNREERARLKRDAFERAGIRSLNQRGYAGLSLNALADELGASRSTFYYTFADKDALLEACARRSHARILAVLTAVDEASGPMLPNMAAGLTKLFSEHVSNLEPILRGCIYASLSSGKEAVAEAEWQGIAARMARLLAECREEDGCVEHGVEKLELVLLSALRNIAVGTGLAEFPGGNPYGNAAPGDYLAPFLIGLLPE